MTDKEKIDFFTNMELPARIKMNQSWWMFLLTRGIKKLAGTGASGREKEAQIQYETSWPGGGQRLAHQTDVQRHRQSRAGNGVVPQRLPAGQQSGQVRDVAALAGHRQPRNPQRGARGQRRVPVRGAQLPRPVEHLGRSTSPRRLRAEAQTAFLYVCNPR